jgi:hypothetical protein
VQGVKGDKTIKMNDDVPFFMYSGEERIYINDMQQLPNIPDHDRILWGDYSFSSYGYLGNNTYKICILGDSASCFDWADLKKMVDSRFNLNTEIYAFVFGGLDLPQLYQLFKHEILPLKPHIVIYNYYQNDTNQHRLIQKNGTVHVAYSYERVPYAFKSQLSQFLLAHSKFYTLFNRYLVQLLERYISGYAPRYYYPGAAVASQCLADMVRLCRENEITLAVVNFSDISYNFPTDDFVKNETKKNNIGYFDIRNEFIRLGYNQDEKFKDIRAECVAHYNRAGQSLVQKLIFKHMVEKEMFSVQ